MMDAQEIFDTVRDHLLKQMKKSKTQGPAVTMCLYRSPKGLACAVGCLIPDSIYSEDMEGQDIEDLLAEGSWFGDQLDHLRPHVELLMDLQEVHDTNYPSSWKKKLDAVAQKYWLES